MTINQTLFDQLQWLLQRDQDTREKLLQEKRLFGCYADEMQQVHRDNAAALAQLVQQYGWPGTSLVGLEGCRMAWMIAQHSIGTPALQRGFLRDLQAAAEQGEVPMQQLALLTDRIRFNEGRAQVYGTVLDWDASGELNCAVENADDLDERRAAVGLEPFLESLQKQRQAIAAEGGQAPADYSRYRAEAEAWAKQTGWR